MNLAYLLDAWIYRKWYKRCILEICNLDPESEQDRTKIKNKILDLIDKNGIPMSKDEMSLFEWLAKSITWGFWYWVNRMQRKLVKKGMMNKDKFYEIADEAFYPFMVEKIWEMRDTNIAAAIMGRRKRDD